MPVVVMGWITLVLCLDADGSSTTQWLLGALTWLLLAAVWYRESALVRAQSLVVVLFATAVEYTFSPLLEVYLYRLDNVPAYVPPGHGLVYLAALAIGRSSWMRAHVRGCVAVVVATGAAWAGWGLFGADRADALGAFWFLCLAAFLRWGPSRPLYVGAFVVVSYLEIVGTGVGAWTWQSSGPAGIVAIGNPPSGAAGGYGWFDLAALTLAPRLLAWSRSFLGAPTGADAGAAGTGAAGAGTAGVGAAAGEAADASPDSLPAAAVEVRTARPSANLPIA